MGNRKPDGGRTLGLPRAQVYDTVDSGMGDLLLARTIKFHLHSVVRVARTAQGTFISEIRAKFLWIHLLGLGTLGNFQVALLKSPVGAYAFLSSVGDKIRGQLHSAAGPK